MAPLVSKSRSGGRWSVAGSSRLSSPASTIFMTWAAITGFVELAIASWSSTRMARTPSAVPVAPLQVPSAVITVAVIPPPPAMASRAAWNFAAVSEETGSELMAANASDGNGAGDLVTAVGVGVAVATAAGVPIGEGVADDVRVTTRRGSRGSATSHDDHEADEADAPARP